MIKIEQVGGIEVVTSLQQDHPQVEEAQEMSLLYWILILFNKGGASSRDV